MWYLNKPNKATIIWYLDLFLDKVANDICNSDLDQDVKDVLVPNGTDKHIVRALLIARPKTLYGYANWLENKIDEKNLWTDDTKNKLLKAFNYEGLLSSNKSNAYALAKRIGRNTCTYCNRIYTFTVYEPQTGAPIVRPDLDHWLAKDNHPLTSMSIYNLIPSCPICNRGIKLRKDFDLNKHIHPYLANEPAQFKFRYHYLPNSEVDIVLQVDNDKEKETAKMLKTEDVYKPHGNLEVKEILDFLYGNTQAYLDDLHRVVMSSFGGKITQEQAFRILFGAELDSTKDLDRPLSKLKRDILEQIEDIHGIKLI